MLCCAGCAHAPLVVAPEPAPTFSREEVADFVRLMDSGDFPGVITMMRRMMDYACDNEALAGRDTSACDQL